MNNHKTKKMFLATALVSLVALGLPACVAQSDAVDAPAAAAVGSTTSELSVTPFTANCTSDCSAGNGVPITKTGCISCSANSFEVVCDGTTYKCASACVQPPKPSPRLCPTGWQWCGCPDQPDPYGPVGWHCGDCY
jgi:hypothetical protein